jgi:hypothetical protein
MIKGAGFVYNYRILLRVAYPTAQCPTDFNTRASEIYDAVNRFNHKYLGKKCIDDISLSDHIIINLSSNRLLKNPTREFAIFSKDLKYNSSTNWKAFTKDPDRMFEATVLDQPIVRKEETGKLTLEKIFEMNSIEQLDSTKEELQKLLNAVNLKLESLQ